ncbi:MAG TPA: hypothetical protein DEQ47_03360 [Solibacterales bacterium]|nr:hypothetical protein [Bryobacterales bacterium]
MHRGFLKILLPVLLSTVPVFTAAADTARVVNAASLAGTSVAPGAIVSIFGTGFTRTVAAVSDPANPPTTLGGVSVTIGGVPAKLFYVSPTQINAVVSPSTPAGVQQVVITSASGTTTTSVTIDVNAPPGIFSLTATGTRDGAIIDALTYHIGAFSTRTGTASTFLSIFTTGGNFATPPIVTIGGVNVPVTYAGPAPCCTGLQQINIQLPDSLAGAGRVAVTIQAGGQVSNVVEVVLLPQHGQGESASDQDNETRSRELAEMAAVPGTSLILVADENDDVVRVLDVSKRSIVNVISLPSGSQPISIAVNAAGTMAVVAERNTGNVALIDLSTMMVTAQISTGGGPVAISIVGTKAIVVNGDADTVTVVDLATKAAIMTVAVGSGPRGVASDGSGHLFITNENAGTISVLDLGSNTITRTITLPNGARPDSIQILTGGLFAVVTDRATSGGNVWIVNLTTGTTTSVPVNADHSGGTSDVVLVGSTAYIADQTGGRVSVVPIHADGTVGAITTIKVDIGARAIAVDTKDNILAVTNEGSGVIVLIDLSTGQIITRVNAIKSQGSGDDGEDDHSDHDGAFNQPQIASITPLTGHANTTFTITVNGSNLTGATGLIFVDPALLPGKGHGKGQGNPAFLVADPAYTVTNIAVNSGGTQLTATVAISASAAAGTRLVRVITPNGDSPAALVPADTFTLTL